MAYKFDVPNEALNLAERTFMRQDVLAGVTTLEVDNTVGYAVNDYLVVGKEGMDTTELRRISSITDANTLVLTAALSFKHFASDPVIKLNYNQRRLYGGTTEGGVTNLIGTFDIKVDSLSGTPLSYGGSTYTWFKSTYYNSILPSESSIDSAIAVSIATKMYASTLDVRRMAGFEFAEDISNSLVEWFIQGAMSEINGAIADRYTIPLSKVPWLIRKICTYMAAGELMIHVYGEKKKDDPLNGWPKILKAQGMLEKIALGELSLVGEDGIEPTASETDLLKFWPDATSTPKFSVDDPEDF